MVLKRECELRTDELGKLLGEIRLEPNCSYILCRDTPLRAATKLPSRQDLVNWISDCVIGDLRTLDRGISVVEAAKTEQGLPIGMGGGNFLFAAGCLMAVEYFGQILVPGADALTATRKYAQRFLKPVDDRYPKMWDLLWRAFRNGIAHGSWPQPVIIRNDPSHQLRLGVGNLRSDPHFAPHPKFPGSLLISAPRFLDDIELSIENGFNRWILEEADDNILTRAAPQLLEVSEKDAVGCQQFNDAFLGRLV
jgi:hypothetical protein